MFFKPGLNKSTMINITCNLLKQHANWSLETIMGSVVPAYPTSNARGTSDFQRGDPGTR